jgi:Holliday junction resolvase
MPTTAKKARGMGGKAEAILLEQLSSKGYEARRTHLSAFPDIIAWDDNEVLLIEVKARTVRGEEVNEKSVVAKTLSAFRRDAKRLQDSELVKVLCFIRLMYPYHDQWKAYSYSKDSGTREVDVNDYC